MSGKMKVLLAEDDSNLGTLLTTFLKAKGYAVEWAENGKIALEKYRIMPFDFLILDVMMPEMDGFALAKEVREIDKNIPILFLTAKSLKEDKLLAFDIGADDYLTKPFSMEELLARIQAISKRTYSGEGGDGGQLHNLGKAVFDVRSRVLTIGGEERKLTTKESQLLDLLCKNRNEVLDRQAALRAIWGDDNYFNGRSMDVYIAKLRKLLKEENCVDIMNIHGKGFKLSDLN